MSRRLGALGLFRMARAGLRELVVRRRERAVNEHGSGRRWALWVLAAAPLVAACSGGGSTGSGASGTSAETTGSGAGGGSTGSMASGGGASGDAIGKGAALSPTLVGQNLWYPDGLASLWPAVKASGVTLVRIGGNAPNKTPPSNAQYLDWVNQIRAIGAEPVVQVSQLVTDAQAKDLVTFLNVTKGLKIRLWNIGNEPDLDKIPVEQVAAYVRGHAAAMRAADPTIQIFAPDLAWYDEPYLDALLGGASDITGKDTDGHYFIDGVTFHTYPNGATFDRVKAIAAAPGIRANVEKLVAAMEAADAKNGRTGSAKLQWALGEFNITYSNPSNNDVGDYAVTSFLNGQFFAEVFGIGMQYGARYVAPWSIQESSGGRGPQDLGYLDGPTSNARPRSSYFHLQLVASYFHGRYAAGKTNQALVKAYGAGDGQTLAVMIANEDDKNGYPFTLHLDGTGGEIPGALDIGIDSGLSGQVTGEIGAQSTAVLVFDGQGKLTKRVDYAIGDALAWTPPH